MITQAKVPMVIANAGTAWITNLSPISRGSPSACGTIGYRWVPLQHDKVGCKTAAMAYLTSRRARTPPKPSRPASRRPAARSPKRFSDGQPGAGAGLHAVLPTHQDAKPDCMYVFIPSGAHATGVAKAYGELGMRKAGVKLIGPMDLIPDNKLQDMGDAAIGTIVMGNYAVDLDNAENKAMTRLGTKLTARIPIPTSCRRPAGTPCTPSSMRSKSSTGRSLTASR